MSTQRRFALDGHHLSQWIVVLGMTALVACSKAPTAPEKMIIQPAKPGAAEGFAVLRQIEKPDQGQAASDNRFATSTSYVFIDKDSPEYYTIALLEKPLDNQKLADALDPADVVEAALREGANGVVLMSDGDGSISGSFEMRVNGAEIQFGGSGSGGVRGLTRAGDRVSGHIYYFNSFFGSHMAIDASFDAELLQPPKGTPLPAGGGEPGEAFLATIEAMRAGDVDKLLTLMAPDRAKEMEAERGQPDFAENLAFLKAMTPSEVRITGGMAYGERVELTTAGKEDDTPFTGTVEMNWEAGAWRMGKQSQRMGSSSDDSAPSDTPKAPTASEPPKADMVPVLADDGAVCTGFKMSEPEFTCNDGFAVTDPDPSDNAIFVLLAPAKVDVGGAAAMWSNDAPIAGLFADGTPQPSMWLKLTRDDDGELRSEAVYLVDADGNLDDTYVNFSGIESDGKLIGQISQSGSRNDEQWEGIARFNLPVLAVP